MLPLLPPPPQPVAEPAAAASGGLYLSPSKLMALSALLSVLLPSMKTAVESIMGGGITASPERGVSAVPASHSPTADDQVPSPTRWGQPSKRPSSGAATAKPASDDDDLYALDQDRSLSPPSDPPCSCSACDSAPPVPFKCKKLFKGTLDEDVEHFVDLFETQVTLARLTSEDRLLFLPTCLADKAARWYQQEKKLNGPFKTYREVRAALMGRFTPTQAERKTQKLKLRGLHQKNDESVIEFNDKFNALADKYHFGEDKVKDIYVDCLRARLREALDIRAPTTLAEAMRVTVTVDVNRNRRNQAAPQTTTKGAQVNELAHQLDRLSTKRGGQHPYADSHQCAECGRSRHLASKCGVKCSACGRWGHLAESCWS